MLQPEEVTRGAAGATPMAANAATRPPATDEARLSEFFEAANSDVDDDTLASLLKGLSVNQPQWSLRRVSPQLSCVWPAFLHRCVSTIPITVL